MGDVAELAWLEVPSEALGLPSKLLVDTEMRLLRVSVGGVLGCVVEPVEVGCPVLVLGAPLTFCVDIDEVPVRREVLSVDIEGEGDVAVAVAVLVPSGKEGAEILGTVKTVEWPSEKEIVVVLPGNMLMVVIPIPLNEITSVVKLPIMEGVVS